MPLSLIEKISITLQHSCHTATVFIDNDYNSRRYASEGQTLMMSMERSQSAGDITQDKTEVFQLTNSSLITTFGRKTDYNRET